MNNGWVKLHRSMLNWEWFSDSKTFHLFSYILLNASHNEYKHKGRIFEAGQMPFGLSKASIDTGLSIQSIRTCLKRLKSTNEITMQTSRQGSVITVVNWNKYQIATNDLTSNQQTINKRSTSTNNVKNENNVKNIYTPDEILQLYNNNFGSVFGYARGLGSGEYLNNFLESVRWLPDQKSWQELFDKCKGSDYLMGKDGGWHVNLTWLVNYDNAIKVLNGNFDNKNKIKKLDPSFDHLRPWEKDML